MQTINLKFAAATTVYEDVEITIPFFSRSKDEQYWMCVLDENTAIRLVIIGKYVCFIKDAPSDNYLSGKILEAKKEYISCTESEFLEKYDAVIESIHPKLAV